MIPAIPFYMIRHGESTANLAQIVSGQVDVDLTERGVEQARIARAVVESLAQKPSLIVHSHLRRARNTAEVINENLKLPMAEEPLIAEQFFGDWEGQSWSVARQNIREGVDPPNGETHAAFHERVKEALNRIHETHPGPVMIVCHGGVFRAIGALYGSPIFGTENCALHHFEPNAANALMPWRITKFG